MELRKSSKSDIENIMRIIHQAHKKSGFKYCVVIYLEDRSKRIAFEKAL